MMEVSVIGAGVIGSATAYHLARAGVRVTIVDAGGPGGRTSPVTFGWVNANGKAPEHYFELNHAGMQAHRELAAAIPGAAWLHPGGSLEWADEPDASVLLHARAADLAARGYPVEILDADGVRAMEPDLARARHAPRAAVHFPSEMWCDSVAFATTLARQAVGLGARLILGDAVVGLDVHDSHGSGVIVRCASGEHWRADTVVNCAGPDARGVAALAGLDLISEGSLGLTVVTGPVPVRIGRVVRAPGVHFRPDAAGRLVLGSTRADAMLAAGDADPGTLAAGVVDDAARSVPGLAGIPVETARVGRRAVPADGLPVCGALPTAPAVYHLFTHSGVTLAPLLGRLAASEIVDGKTEPMLAPYRPARFESRRDIETGA